MSVETSPPAEQSNSEYDTDLVETASKFVSKVLRHGLEDETASVNSRGWMSWKTIRVLLQKKIDQDVNCRSLLDAVLDADEKDRFQVIEQEPFFKMIRARYGHTQDHVHLYDLSVDDSEQTDYLVSMDGVQDAYISAVTPDIAKQIFIERHLENCSLNNNEISVSETDRINLTARDTPFTHYTQDGSWDETVRCNSMGIQSKYQLTNRRNNARQSND